MHRIRLPAAERAAKEGLPVTTPTRTIYDMAGALRPRDVERLIAAAEDLRLTEASAIRALMRQHPFGRGVLVLREVLGAGMRALTRSDAEDAFVALIRDAGLPEPRMNVWVEGHRVDVLWDRQRVVVEIDGRQHNSWSARRRDRRRDWQLHDAGYRLERVHWLPPRETRRGRRRAGFSGRSAALSTRPGKPAPPGRDFGTAPERRRADPGAAIPLPTPRPTPRPIPPAD